MRPPADNTRLVNMFFPPHDTVTRQEYHRLDLPRARPDPTPRTRPCAACDVPFVPDRRTARFCSRACRRWWHYGAGCRARKTTVAA